MHKEYNNLPDISLIWAQDLNGTIGFNNQLPWKNQKEDMEFFKKMTNRCNVVMGRKTYISIGKPLPNRLNYVLTTRDIDINGCTTVRSIEDVLNKVKRSQTLYVIGGRQVYDLFLKENIVNSIIVTTINNKFAGDTWAPAIPEHYKQVWEEAHLSDEKNTYSYTFTKWQNTSHT